jgi:hypothetical protein
MGGIVDRLREFADRAESEGAKACAVPPGTLRLWAMRFEAEERGHSAALRERDAARAELLLAKSVLAHETHMREDAERRASVEGRRLTKANKRIGELAAERDHWRKSWGGWADRAVEEGMKVSDVREWWARNLAAMKEDSEDLAPDDPRWGYLADVGSILGEDA